MTISVRRLTHDDLPQCSWAGSALHLRQVSRELDRAARGEVIYLVVLDDGAPVAIGGADLVAHAGQAMLWQLSTHPQRQSEGFGTVLIGALASEAAEKGYSVCRVGAETDNPRALALYERLGYTRTGEIEQAEWDEEDPAGGMRRHRAEVVVLTKSIGSTGTA